LAEGVVFVVRRMSFGRRLELTREIRELAQKRAFLEAGAGGDPVAEADVALATAEIDRTYLLWGLEAVDGLEIDGTPATPRSLVEAGPEELVREALEAVRREIGLSGEERKNSESHSISCKATKPDGDATNAAA
jgi:hypothetical protein